MTDLIALALKVKNIGMDKMVKMVDDMVVLLGNGDGFNAKKDQFEKNIES